MAISKDSAKDWVELAGVVAMLKESRVSLTEGCRSIAEIYERICGDPALDPYFEPFLEYDDKTISYPVGQERQNWSQSALERIDRERVAYEESVRESLMQSVASLEIYAKSVAI
ncbi:MAG: hypothetical protein SF172_16290 [Burkholderiales bacterium]|nr:hypothetical protein [Burkholderiales bacterium]